MARFGKIGNLSRDRATSTNAMGNLGLHPSSRGEYTITILPMTTRTCPAVYGGHQILRSGNAGLVALAVHVLEGVHRAVAETIGNRRLQEVANDEATIEDVRIGFLRDDCVVCQLCGRAHALQR